MTGTPSVIGYAKRSARQTSSKETPLPTVRSGPLQIGQTNFSNNLFKLWIISYTGRYFRIFPFCRIIFLLDSKN